MVRRLAADGDQLREPVAVTRGALHGVHQLPGREVIRAGAGHQEAVAVEELHREQVDAAVGREPLRVVLLALDERGRVHDDRVEAAPLGDQRLERLEAVAFQQLDVEPVGVRRRRGGGERRRRGIDAGRRRRACAHRLQAEPARVAEDVEHPGAPGVAREQRAVRGLVEVPARLLAAGERHAGSPRRPRARRPTPARRRRRYPRGARDPRARAWASRSSTAARAAPRPWRAPPRRRPSSRPCRPC